MPPTTPPALPKHDRESPITRVLAWVGLIGLPFAIVYLYLVDPEQAGSVYLQCTFHSLTGYNCPGCGGTRAMHALLHGHVARALWFNPYVVFIAPALSIWLAYACVGVIRNRKSQNHSTRIAPFYIWSLAILLVLFWVIRNVPGYPLGP